MKTIRLFMLLSFVWGSAFSQNLVQNPGFEDGTPPYWWFTQVDSTANARGTISATTLEKQEGNRSLMVNIDTAGTNPWNVQIVSERFPAVKGRDYRLSVWAKSAVASTSRIKIVIQDSAYYFGDDKVPTTTWTQYTKDFTAGEDGLKFIIHFQDSGTFYIDNVSVTELNPVTPDPITDSLKVLAANCDISIGTAVADAPLQAEPNYINALKQHFNMVTAENAMKMDAIKPSETGYNFAAADRLVNFAQANGMKVRGHALVWHSQVPGWITNKTWTRETLLNYLKGYIDTVVTRYKGKISEWDVANEFFNDTANNSFRESVWYKTIGVDVLDSAFAWAHKADPDAKLFYNDYEIERLGGKGGKAYELVKGLKERGAPIYGVGIQAHRQLLDNDPFFAELDSNIRRYAALGLKVAITELDVRIPMPASIAEYNTQAGIYSQFLRLALKNKGTVETFVTWGITDKYSWIPSIFTGEGDALILDANYNAKPAFDSLASVLRTNCAMMTGIEGSEIISTETVKLYPNPFAEMSVIEAKGRFSWEISDITGTSLSKGTAEDRALIGEGLKPGLYNVRISGSKNAQTFKIIKSIN